MHSPALSDIVRRFNNKKVAVVGDIALDSYVYGSIERINPEMPSSPLLRVQKFEHVLGCAGNVANNLAALGARVTLYGVIGQDDSAKHVFQQCKRKGIRLNAISHGLTLVKQRFRELEHYSYLARVDFGEHALDSLALAQEKELLRRIKQDKPEAIVLSDYNKRVFRGQLGKHIIAYAKARDIPTFVDPKPENLPTFHEATLIRPNEKEAREAIGDARDIQSLVKALKDKTRCKYVVITRGSKGMVCFDSEFVFIPTQAKQVTDVTGAGDTVLAALSLALLSGATLEQAAYISNIAAGNVVEKVGTATTTQDEIISRLEKE